MQRFRSVAAIACFFSTFIAGAGEKPTAKASATAMVSVDRIKDKVSVGLGQEIRVRFTVEGDRLVHPVNVTVSGGNQATVGIGLKTTDSTPYPVQGVATRPYLMMSNGLERALTYRALARLKGSREFFEIAGPGEGTIPPGDNALKCWESGSLIEEVLLYDFSLSPKSSP